MSRSQRSEPCEAYVRRVQQKIWARFVGSVVSLVELALNQSSMSKSLGFDLGAFRKEGDPSLELFGIQFVCVLFGPSYFPEGPPPYGLSHYLYIYIYIYINLSLTANP